MVRGASPLILAPEMLFASISSNTTEELSHGRIYRQAQSEPVPDLSRRIVARGHVIPATGKTKTEIAALLGISRQHLYDILEERKPVSPAVAVRLVLLFGGRSRGLVSTRSAYDTWRAERELANEIKKIPTLKPAAA